MIKRISCLYFGIILFSCAGAEALEHEPVSADSTVDLVGKLISIAEFVTSDKPLLRNIVQLVGGKPCPGEGDQPTCFDNDGYRVIYWLEATGENATTRRVQFSIPDIDSGVALNDIVSIFGKWRMVGPAGKTTGIMFAHTNQKTDQKAAIYVRLYDPPKNRESPVMGIVIQKAVPGELNWE